MSDAIRTRLLAIADEVSALQHDIAAEGEFPYYQKCAAQLAVDVIVMQGLWDLHLCVQRQPATSVEF